MKTQNVLIPAYTTPTPASFDRVAVRISFWICVVVAQAGIALWAGTLTEAVLDAMEVKLLTCAYVSLSASVGAGGLCALVDLALLVRWIIRRIGHRTVRLIPVHSNRQDRCRHAGGVEGK